MKGFLILENGEIFEGERIGYEKDCICEVVFNTSMAGYLEVFSDPSYAGQGVVMTYPLIGNYGVIKEDLESKRTWVEAIFIHEMAEVESNFRSQMNLQDFLVENKIPGLKSINTRKLTKLLRQSGTMRGKITSDISNLNRSIQEIKDYNPSQLVEKVSSNKIETFGDGDIKVGLFDFGYKKNILQSLLRRNCRVTIFPQNTSAENILKSDIDGIVLSNGPGDPEECKNQIREIKELYDSNLPIFGICLGHQLMAIATGSKTAKLKYGHRGPNHPVKDLIKDKVYITSQNHGYYVKEETIPNNIAEISHVSMNDGTVEGLKYKNKKINTVQFHPEACPGPEDTAYLFDDFIKILGGNKNAKK